MTNKRHFLVHLKDGGVYISEINHESRGKSSSGPAQYFEFIPLSHGLQLFFIDRLFIFARNMLTESIHVSTVDYLPCLDPLDCTFGSMSYIHRSQKLYFFKRHNTLDYKLVARISVKDVNAAVVDCYSMAGSSYIAESGNINPKQICDDLWLDETENLIMDRNKNNSNNSLPFFIKVFDSSVGIFTFNGTRDLQGRVTKLSEHFCVVASKSDEVDKSDCKSGVSLSQHESIDLMQDKLYSVAMFKNSFDNSKLYLITLPPINNQSNVALLSIFSKESNSTLLVSDDQEINFFKDTFSTVKSSSRSSEHNVFKSNRGVIYYRKQFGNYNFWDIEECTQFKTLANNNNYFS